MAFRDEKDHGDGERPHLVALEAGFDNLDFAYLLVRDAREPQTQRLVVAADLRALVLGKESELLRLLFLSQFVLDGASEFFEDGRDVADFVLLPSLQRTFEIS